MKTSRISRLLNMSVNLWAVSNQRKLHKHKLKSPNMHNISSFFMTKIPCTAGQSMRWLGFTPSIPTTPPPFSQPQRRQRNQTEVCKRCRYRTNSTLYVAHSVLLLKASVAITRCNSFRCVAPHGARYLLAYSIARILFSDLTNSMNSCSLNWNSNLLCHQKKQEALLHYDN